MTPQTLTKDDLEKRLSLAESLAVKAGKLALSFRDSGLDIKSKSRMDFVTEADTSVEALLRQELLQHFPEDFILGEEGGLGVNDSGDNVSISDSSNLWILDPIDGTHNYLMGLDHWSVSIGFRTNKDLALGCVYAPDRDQLFSGMSGCGAFLNKVQLSCGQSTNDHALIGLGISNRVEYSEHIDLFRRLHESGIEFRRFGSAALSICDVAAGNIDGYYEVHLNSWDCAAAIVISREAGVNVNGFTSFQSMTEGDRFFAAAPGFDWKTVVQQ